MAFSTGSGPQRSEINVTPLIDVLLVLLIIFMVIVPIQARGVHSDVPQGRASRNEATLPPITLDIIPGDAGKPTHYRVDSTAVEGNMLEAHLSTALATRADRVVFIRANRGISFQPVAEAVAVAKRAGAIHVSLTGPLVR